MRRIDHLVIAVRNLDQAADVYRKLGFQVGTRNRHPWETENRLIQFESSFIELITVGAGAQVMPHQPRQFSFGAFIQNFLEKREGIAMMVLSSEDARADAALFREQGIGDFEPFWFSRKGVRPDGSEVQVAFTLAFAHAPLAPDLSFFVCQQHYPENFWNRQFQRHSNTATNIVEVTLAGDDPKRHQHFLTAFSGAVPHHRPDGGMAFRLDDGHIQIVPSLAQNRSHSSTRLTSLAVRVADLESAKRLIRREGLQFMDSNEYVVIAPNLLNGVELRLATPTKHL